MTILSQDSRKISELPRITRLSSDDMLVFERDIPIELYHKIFQEKIRHIHEYKDLYLENPELTAQEYDPEDELWGFLFNETPHVIESALVANSYNIKYSDLTAQILAQISANISVGSMAYGDYWEYAKYYHTHGFTKESVIALDYEIPTTNFIISNTKESYTKTIGTPKFEFDEEIDAIGDMKLIAITNREKPNVYSDDFNGWVYADGSSYRRQDFPKAYEYFKVLNGSDSDFFVVPKVDDFVRCDCSSYIQHHEGNLAIDSHTHGFDVDQVQPYGGVLSTSVKIGVNNNRGGTEAKLNAMCSGIKGGKSSKGLKNLSAVFDQNIYTTNTAQSIEIAHVSQYPNPDYVKIPMMVYIGKRGVQ